jgi:hypothetical protein
MDADLLTLTRQIADSLYSFVQAGPVASVGTAQLSGEQCFVVAVSVETHGLKCFQLNL